MHESPADIEALQELLDRSYAAAGAHLISIHTPERRLSAEIGALSAHIRTRPHVSATHLPGEELAVTVHGRAVPVDIHADEGGGFRRALLEVYEPRYGPDWEKFLDSGPVYARIGADRMFTFAMPSA